MTLDRRDFLTRATLGAAALSLPWGSRVLARPGQDNDPVLVTLFLRGAADGLNLVVPERNRARYDQLRPTIGVPAGRLRDLGGGFGLHPSLAPLMQYYNQNQLAIVHAVGSLTGNTRSHFKAMDFMERGGGLSGAGWVNRTLGALGTSEVTAGIALGLPQASMAGGAPSLTTPSLARMQSLGVHGRQRRAAVLAMRAGQVKRTARAGFDAVAKLQPVAGVAAPAGAPANEHGLYQSMRDAAALIKGDLGVRAISLDMGGWDTHSDETARLNSQAAVLAGALRAFWDALSVREKNRTVVLVMTEFGRTAAENGALGTDHGTASALFALGGRIKGGRVIADWPGLAPGDLQDGRDLKATTDFRDVFAEVLDEHMGLSAAQAKGVFSGRQVRASDYPGLL